jgi:hypothetical protein
LLKLLILILLAAVLLSLFSGLGFLFKDTSVPESKRVLYALGIRVSLTVALLLTIFAGLYTGNLELSAPWHQY